MIECPSNKSNVLPLAAPASRPNRTATTNARPAWLQTSPAGVHFQPGGVSRAAIHARPFCFRRLWRSCGPGRRQLLTAATTQTAVRSSVLIGSNGCHFFLCLAAAPGCVSWWPDSDSGNDVADHVIASSRTNGTAEFLFLQPPVRSLGRAWVTT